MTIKSYTRKLNLIEAMIRQDKTASEIDHLVKVDDEPAIAALAKLDRMISQASAQNTQHILSALQEDSLLVMGATLAASQGEAAGRGRVVRSS